MTKRRVYGVDLLTSTAWEVLTRITVIAAMCGILSSAIVTVYQVVQFFKRLECKMDELLDSHGKFMKIVERVVERP